MNLKINESADGGWDLWVTPTDDPAAKASYAAWGCTTGQLEALVRIILNEAADTEPTPEVVTIVRADGKTFPVGGPARSGDELTTNGKTVASLALYTMLTVLDGWIEGAQENHRAMEHRHENTGSECWRQIEPADVRGMVNDVARELGISEFPIPAAPREDAP